MFGMHLDIMEHPRNQLTT